MITVANHPLVRVAFGRVPTEVLDILRECDGATAAALQENVSLRLSDAGFTVQKEAPVEYCVNRGRIDILATRSGQKIWIELDRCTPRRRSILKVRAAISAQGGCGLVVCRTRRKSRSERTPLHPSLRHFRKS